MPFPRHVLVANVYFAPRTFGGATVVAEAVARELVRRGLRVTALSMMERPDLPPYAVMKTETAGIANYLVNLPPARSYAERYDNPGVTEIAAGLIADLGPDLVHAHCLQEIGVGPLVAARLGGVPSILSVHDFWWQCERQFMIRPDGRYCGQFPIEIEACRGCVDRIGRARTRFARLGEVAAGADAITFPSRFARDLSVASGLPAAKAHVWTNGVRRPGPGFFAAQAARRAADPRLVFGFLGGPSQIKGWPLIRAAFADLGRDDFRGYLVEGSLAGDWWDWAETGGMRGDWQIHPRFGQDDADAFYAKIDVLLFPSQWKETFGLAIREAAARGIRVIQTASGGTEEWDGADPARMLPIGAGPAALKAEVLRVLETPGDHAAPRPVTGYDDQAEAFLDLAAGLAAREG